MFQKKVTCYYCKQAGLTWVHTLVIDERGARYKWLLMDVDKDEFHRCWEKKAEVSQ